MCTIGTSHLQWNTNKKKILALEGEEYYACTVTFKTLTPTYGCSAN
jgi:hypothetical protein